MSKLPILKATDLQKQFEELGYVILPFAKDDILENLGELYQKTIDPDFSGLYASLNANPFEKNNTISQLIMENIQPVLEQNFQHLQYILGHFMVKSSQKGDEFQLHQDWSITYENEYSSAQVWIPLADTNRNNGCMFVVPKSHLFFNNYRSGSLDIPRIERDKDVDLIINPVEVKAGEMLVYHQGLFHGSFANNSDRQRIAVLISTLQEDAPMCYFQSSDTLIRKSKLEVYHISPETMLSQLPGLEKGGEVLLYNRMETITYTLPKNNKITKHELLEKNKLAGGNQRKGLFSVLADMFKSLIL